jgi:hypothetical protein
MTVYIVYSPDWDETDPILAVFSSRALADAFVVKQCGNGGDLPGYYRIDEIDVDK